MKIDENQNKIINSNESKILVVASAASGKTTCLIERIKFLINNGVPKSGIVVITFTNAAAEEIRERIGIDTRGVFIGTIHSYANYLLKCAGITTKALLKDENFDELFPLVVKNPKCIQPVQHLLLDEAQDTDSPQWEFILDMVKPQNWFIIGDHRQSIYGFRDARPDIFVDLMYKKGVSTYHLGRNYRNGSEILSFAQNILLKLDLDYRDDSLSYSQKEGRVSNVALYDPHLILQRINLSLHKGDHYKDWFILTRTNQESNDIYQFLSQNDIPCDTFKKGGMSSQEIKDRMNEDKVKILTIHTAKGLENKNVVVIGALFYNNEERRIAYVAATRAKDLLIWMPKKKKSRSKTYIKKAW